MPMYSLVYTPTYTLIPLLESPIDLRRKVIFIPLTFSSQAYAKDSEKAE
jgi:hypothetical protein